MVEEKSGMIYFLCFAKEVCKQRVVLSFYFGKKYLRIVAMRRVEVVLATTVSVIEPFGPDILKGYR